ncbi:MAG: ATP-binding protein, partial [Calditrichota bacterium]
MTKLENQQILEELKQLRKDVKRLNESYNRTSNAERSVTESENRYRRLIRYLTDYIYTVQVKDGEAVETYHGPGCVAVTGYQSEEFDADPDLWFSMVHKADKKVVLKQGANARDGKSVPPLEHRIIHRDGSERWIRNTIVLRKNAVGEVTSYDGLIRDITERKQAENEAEVRRKQLVQADKMATLGILSSGMAHEINNPNNYIQLNAQLFKKVWDDVLPILDQYYKAKGDFSLAGMQYSQERDAFNELLSGTLDGARRIERIIRNLKTFARPDITEVNVPVSMGDVLESGIELSRALIQQSTKHFKTSIQKKLPLIMGNAQQLEQVIINLLTNACQALEDSQQSIRLKAVAAPNGIVVEVEDTGSGIPEENLAHIFDPFFTTKRDSDGTGLGLSISYQIVQRHGGDLAIRSSVGKGTTVTLFLPVDANEYS